MATSATAANANATGYLPVLSYSQSILNEIKKFYKHVNQLNILLKETNNACKELKSLQQSSQLSEEMENLQINDLDEMFIKSLQKKRTCFVILGQNALAQAILANELLGRYLLPFEVSTNRPNEENWRFVRVKHGKIGGYTYQLVDSEFEVMSSEQLNKKFTFATPGKQTSSMSTVSSRLANSKGSLSAIKDNKLNSSKQTYFSSQLLGSSSQQQTATVLNNQPLMSSSANSSTNFTIPVEALRLDQSLASAREQLERTDLTEEEARAAQQRFAEVDAVAENHAVLEVTLDLKLLEHNVEMLVHSRAMNQAIFECLLADVIPVFLYSIVANHLSDQDLNELNRLKPLINHHPILFVKIPEVDKFAEKTIVSTPCSSTTPSPSPSTTSVESTSSGSGSTSSSQSQTKKANALLKYLHQMSSQQQMDSSMLNGIGSSFEIFKQLCELGYLSVLPATGTGSGIGGGGGVGSSNDDVSVDWFLQAVDHRRSTSECLLTREDSCSSVWTGGTGSSPVVRFWSIQSEFCERWHLFMPIFCTYLKRYLKSFSVRGTTILFKFHEYCLSKFINFAFEMARDMMVTPRKIEYAREKEQILYESLLSLTSMKQEELKNLINNAIETHREQILNEVRAFQFIDVELINCYSSPVPDTTAVTMVTMEESSANTSTDNSESESPSTGPTTDSFDANGQFLTVRYARDYKKCTNQIQELVISRLNNAIAQKLTESVEILKETYLGTLKRCLITLEEMNSAASAASFNEPNSASVSEALQQIVNAAYHVELNITGSSSFLKILILRMKELIKNMPWSASPKLDEEWKVLIASNMLDSLSESKLAKVLCNQMKERLKSSHNLFTNSLRLLETKHTGRLERNEESQALIRKILAPKFAKLCLESTSLKDYVLYGFPALGREIGRGQYGVVYSCARWGRYENLAVKSVVPPDEKHWNDLALEFHYTKQIADHERIVKLLGSVIDYAYGNGQSPAVLLIMEAMKRDLYSALKSGLEWKKRIQISVDVVHGIRYLHSLGLVHRDIKLKNVLLDEHNRAKITDLGFCKPEAMMSGSIVGTPVHMCPEMFNSKYDNSVDIYAFGILFWYICAGAVTLPKNFEMCGTKDDLWSAVKRGVRPERLDNFDDECWRLMEMCWRHDPKQRPHIGIVNDALMNIMEKYKST